MPPSTPPPVAAAQPVAAPRPPVGRLQLPAAPDIDVARADALRKAEAEMRAAAEQKRHADDELRRLEGEFQHALDVQLTARAAREDQRRSRAPDTSVAHPELRRTVFAGTGVDVVHR